IVGLSRRYEDVGVSIGVTDGRALAYVRGSRVDDAIGRDGHGVRSHRRLRLSGGFAELCCRVGGVGYCYYWRYLCNLRAAIPARHRRGNTGALQTDPVRAGQIAVSAI